MESYLMTARVQDIDVLQISADPSEQRIFVGSPFYGYPTLDGTDHKEVSATPILILDLNVFSFFRSGKNPANVKELLMLAGRGGMEIMPLVAVMEQHRSHAKPRRAFRHYVWVLRRSYGVRIGPKERKELYALFAQFAPNIKENTRLMRDYLVLIKHFYHQKSSLEEKVRGLSALVEAENLPMFSFAFLVGCVYFFVKASPTVYIDEIVSKVQSDMEYSEANEEGRLWNVASDLMLYLSAVEIFRDRYTGERRFSYIASADITSALILGELCHVKVVHNDNHNTSHVAFRPTGQAGIVVDPILRACQKPVDKPAYIKRSMKDDRRINLARVADRYLYRGRRNP